MVMVTAPVWEGYPGAASRVVLPLTLAFNVLVPAGRRWLPVLVLGNLSVFAGLAEMDPPIRDFYQLRGERLYTKSVVVERGAGWYQAESDGKKSWRWARGRRDVAPDEPRSRARRSADVVPAGGVYRPASRAAREREGNLEHPAVAGGPPA